MAELASTEEGAPAMKYHRHPLFVHLPLREAIPRGLAVPAQVDCANNEPKPLRPARSLDNFRRDYCSASPEVHSQGNKSSLNATPEKFPPSRGQAPRKSLSLENLRTSNSSASGNFECPEVHKDVRKHIQEKAQETAQELRDRLGLHGDVPIPAPLRIRKQLPVPVLEPIHEGKYNDIENDDHAEAPALFQTTSPTLTSTEPRASEPQTEPQPTKLSEFEKWAEKLFEPSLQDFSLDSATSPVRQTSHTTSSTDNATQQQPRENLRNTRSLGNLDTELLHLPLHLQPENRYSPRPPLAPERHISFATAAIKYDPMTGEVTQTPVKGAGERKISHMESKGQGTSHHGPSSFICSFTFEQKELETDILALLDKMSGFPPPPCPPPSYPPPPPPKQSRQSARRTSGSAARYPGLVVQDFSLPSSALSYALVNPYDDETNAATTAAAATAEEQPLPPSRSDALLRANAELARMAAEAETSDEGSVSAPAASSAAAGAGVATGVAAGPAGPVAAAATAAGALGGRLPKASFLERCGKALTKKRRIWKDKKGEKKGE
ncbi:hypothetical protein HD806DRAFT_552780 [Xylariaceae sp. AK1471]|nr:hypothetical protein HD806DRAFT_552780 [Xylariaceae sp. AK1471]